MCSAIMPFLNRMSFFWLSNQAYDCLKSQDFHSPNFTWFRLLPRVQYISLESVLFL